MRKAMIWIRGVAVLPGLATIGLMGSVLICRWYSVLEVLESANWWYPVLLFILPLLNLLVVLKKTSGKILKTVASLTALVFAWVFHGVLDVDIGGWLGFSYHGGPKWCFTPVGFFISISILLVVALNLIAVLRPKIPTFLKETKKENPHLLVAYGFATVLCILLSMLIFVIAMMNPPKLRILDLEEAYSEFEEYCTEP